MKTVTIDSKVSGIYEVSFNEDFPVHVKKLPNRVTTTIGHYVSSFVLGFVLLSLIALIAEFVISRHTSFDRGFSHYPTNTRVFQDYLASIAVFLGLIIPVILSFLWFFLYEKRMRIVKEYSLIYSCIEYNNKQDYNNALDSLVRYIKTLKLVSSIEKLNLAFLYKATDRDDLAREWLNSALSVNPNNVNQQVKKI
jgi:tetratricopeptide (TPR) repeat protein